MNIKIKTSSIVKLLFLMAAVIYIIINLFANPYIVSAGIKNGLMTSYCVLIPSLFPFLIISSFILKSNLSYYISKPLSRLTSILFKLPACTGATIILSLIGGYPIGAKLISILYEKQEITKAQAERMLCFCVNSGPAFLISAVGAIMLSSVKIGLFLFISQTIASIVTGIIVSRKNPPNDNLKSIARPKLNPSVGLVEAVSESINNIILICGFVVFFSCITEIMKNSPFISLPAIFLSLKYNEYSPTLFAGIIYGIIEITCGCRTISAAASLYNILAISALCSFSGISIICQLTSIIKKSGLSIKPFLKSRLIHIPISILSMLFLIRMFPTALETFSSGTKLQTAQIFSVSPVASLALLCSAFIFVFSTSNLNKVPKKKI